MDPDLIDEDASLRRNLAALGPDGLRELQTILEAPQPHRDELLRATLARPGLHYLATLIAMADTDEIVRLRLLRALRDLGLQLVADRRHQTLTRRTRGRSWGTSPRP